MSGRHRLSARARWSARYRKYSTLRAIPSVAGFGAVWVAAVTAGPNGAAPIDFDTEIARTSAIASWHHVTEARPSTPLEAVPLTTAARSAARSAARTAARTAEEQVVAEPRTGGHGDETDTPGTGGHDRQPENPNRGGSADGGAGTSGKERTRTEPASRQAGERPSLKRERDRGLTAREVARAVGAAHADVADQWPVLERALRDEGMTDVRSQIAALATVVTEVGPALRPINEYGGWSYFTRMYEGRSDLGNVRPGDGARFHGRGYIQLTGRANYRSYGQRLGLPLEDRPGMALRPYVGARVLAEYFKERGIDDDARRGRWRETRLKVNGGYNGWTRYRWLVSRLLHVARH